MTERKKKENDNTEAPWGRLYDGDALLAPLFVPPTEASWVCAQEIMHGGRLRRWYPVRGKINEPQYYCY